MIGALRLAQDLILFFIFFEVTLIPMYFMIGVWGGSNGSRGVDLVLPVHVGGSAC